MKGTTHLKREMLHVVYKNNVRIVILSNLEKTGLKLERFALIVLVYFSTSSLFKI